MVEYNLLQREREKEEWIFKIMDRSRNQNRRYRDRQDSPYEERVIQVNRVSKKTKGGNKIAFSVLAVVGDKKGQVGVGLGKALDVRAAIIKSVTYAKKHLITVPLKEERTIPHIIQIKYGAARLLLKPAPKGSGIIAGGTIRTVLELAGVKDVVGKILGTNNKISNTYATMYALQRMRSKKKEF
jgi:small subunit ribosomal protein S5